MPTPARTLYIALLAEKYGARLKRFIFSRSRNAADVSDLAQEVFLRLLRVENVNAIRSPEAYLFTVASHVLHQHHAAQASAPPTVDITELYGELRLAASEEPGAQVDLQQRVADLERMLEMLSPKVRTTLLLHRFAGYSIEEIAREIGVSKPTAKRYLAAGLAHCRNQRMDPGRAGSAQ
jgi:RNA polymerase sigma-70 factor (ECF subfamily)